jgi:uncharacterized protein
MRKINGDWLISPRDIIAELECDHRLNLDWAVASGKLKMPTAQDSPELELLAKQGILHEQSLVSKLKQSGTFIDIGSPEFNDEWLREAHNRTITAIRSGVDTIYQATFYTDNFLGFADFLILNKNLDGSPIKDESGRLVYDPVDAKSARSAKSSAVLQVATYAAVMQEIGLATPLKVRLWLGGDDNNWEADAVDLIDLANLFRSRAYKRILSFSSTPEKLWAPPIESCTRCRWKTNCESGRREANDISLVQGIRSSTRNLLVLNGINTVSQLAVAEDGERPKKPREVSKETYRKLRDQAAIQQKGPDAEGKPQFEFKDTAAFGLLPESNPGDIWFDIEGDPFANQGKGLEYMLGYLYLENGQYKFNSFDAKDASEEKEAFISFVDYVIKRRSDFPGMHVYHYASYEISALLRLGQRHGIYEIEVDRLIRDGVFVDLYNIVRNAFRFSTESMSIKYIEPVYLIGHRDNQVTNAISSVVQFETALTLLSRGDLDGFNAILLEIKAYNKDDVDSTQQLDAWLREQAAINNIEIAGLRPNVEVEWEDLDDDTTFEPVAQKLLELIPDGIEQRSEVQVGIAYLSAAISFHRREARPAWWAIFERAAADLDELDNFSDVVVPTKVETGNWGLTGKQRNQRREVRIVADGVELDHYLDFDRPPQLLYEFAPDGFKTVQGTTRGFNEAKIISINGSVAILEESESKSLKAWVGAPLALLPGKPIPTSIIERVLREDLGAPLLLRAEAGEDLFPQEAWCDLLLRRRPRQLNGALAMHGDDVAKITESLLNSDNSYVAVQGPPGTGKTHVGAHVIANLVKQGWRIGIVAQSHAVVEHLMHGVLKIDSAIPMAKKGQSDRALPSFHISDLADWASSQFNGYLIGGTTWTFCSPRIRALDLDLLVIDEAGQYSLANTLATVSAAKRALLLGDPQQLPQVSQGSHIEPVNESVLTHLLGEHKTMPLELGYFLETTYRLHPNRAQAVSKLQYEGRLHSDVRCTKRNLAGTEPGLHVIRVEHEGNTVSSIEEADEILARLPNLIGTEWTAVNKSGQTEAPRPLTQSDILIVTGYNAQVRYLKSRLRAAGYPDIRVGTVDKFQGQEAPIVFVSMVTSSSEDLPRGIEFLLSPNRLNVAISRAQWACFIVQSTSLEFMQPTSPEGMVMLGKFVGLCNHKNQN